MKFWLSVFALLPLPSHALQVFTEYRIAGDEIVSVTAPEIGVEEPLLLVIGLADGGTLQIQSDNLLDDCHENLERAKGDPSASVQIVINERAITMNAVEVIQCAMIYP